jgi:hypothetical protein
MKRSLFLLAAAGILLLVVCGLHKLGGSTAPRPEPMPVSIGTIKSADPLDSPAGWRYRQNLPRHWRHIMLQK